MQPVNELLSDKISTTGPISSSDSSVSPLDPSVYTVSQRGLARKQLPISGVSKLLEPPRLRSARSNYTKFIRQRKESVHVARGEALLRGGRSKGRSRRTRSRARRRRRKTAGSRERPASWTRRRPASGRSRGATATLGDVAEKGDGAQYGRETLPGNISCP